LNLELISQSLSFGGMQHVYSHHSKETGCVMRFGLFLPPRAKTERVPVLYWLSGLTCTEENFIVKAGAQRIAALLGLALLVPDTSPRGLDIQGESDSYDVGLGAGFYLDATEAPWCIGYRMYSYVSQELYGIASTHFPIDSGRTGIFGHSMGGHGALMLALRNPDQYLSVSAFSPISSPNHSPWGEKALTRYLGRDRSKWRTYDAIALIEDRGWAGPAFLIDQGTDDPFLADQLKPQLLVEACQRAAIPLQFRMQTGYDHSYHFVATFIEEHLHFHARLLESHCKRS
jgi:S-formylglutathione hydrolase